MSERDLRPLLEERRKEEVRKDRRENVREEFEERRKEVRKKGGCE